MMTHEPKRIPTFLADVIKPDPVRAERARIDAFVVRLREMSEPTLAARYVRKALRRNGDI
jgi:hypothetical protein